MVDTATPQTPVYDRTDSSGATKLLGVVSADVSVDRISAKLLSVPQSKRGRSYAFLLDLHGASSAPAAESI